MEDSMDGSVVHCPEIKEKWQDILQFGVQEMTNTIEGDTAFYNPFLYSSP
jgi:hypothetical protein